MRPHLHNNEKVHNQYERSQNAPRELIGREEVMIEEVPVDPVSDDDHENDGAGENDNDPEENDATVPLHPPSTREFAPMRIELLL